MEPLNPAAITIRPAVAADAGGIARAFLESAEHHAGLDPELYFVPPIDEISARYREGRQQAQQETGGGITLVAELGGEIVGFLDARLDRFLDPMHREMLFCHISEIGVNQRDRSRGIGTRLLQAAEDWGRLQGAEFASLEHHTANIRAASFYRQRMGYRPVSLTAIKRL